MTQIVVKLLLTIVASAPVAYGLVWLWRQDIDVKRTFSPKRAIDAFVDAARKGPSKLVVVREPTNLYQDGHSVGVARQATIDENAKTVFFEEISNSRELNVDKPFEYRTHILKMTHADTVYGMLGNAPEKGQIILKAQCSIVGSR